jgi:drug/metabolite transporter (DMT)-like permease
MSLASPAAAQLRANDIRGALLILASGVTFTVSTALIKHLSAELPETVVVFWRHAFATLWFLPVVVASGGRLVLTRRLGGHLIRSAFGFSSFFGFIWSIDRLPLADGISIAFTAPLWSMVLSVFVLKEAVNPLRWLATCIGFGGVLLIVKPSGALDWAVVVGLCSAMVASGAMMMVKRLSATEPPDRIAFYFMAAGMVFALPAAVAHWQWPSAGQHLWLVGIGLLSYAGQICLSRGYAIGQFTKMAPMDFFRMPTAILLGFVMFGDLPDWSGIAGMTVIAAASLYILLGGRRRRT